MAVKEEHTELVAFLEEARQAAIDLDALEKRAKASEIDRKRYEKMLGSERKAVADQIAQVVKQRKEEIADTYDRELRSDQEKLKKVRAKREKAKTKGMRARIEDETADLIEENKKLNSRLSALFKQNNLPFFCGTDLYYALFFTRSPRDFMTLVLTALVCFLLVPCGIYFALPEGKLWNLIIIYLVTIVVFMGLYIVVANKTKVDHMSVLREGRKLRMQVKANKRQMRSIRKSIEKDRNDDIYNLEKYDREIQEIEDEIKDIRLRKEDALHVFETDTALVLTKEIKQNNQDRIDQLSSRKTDCENLSKTLSSQLKEMKINVADKYESRIGREFMAPDKLGALIRMLQEERAESLSEAQEMYRNRLK